MKALLCDILHLEGRKISKNKYVGHQPKKFENPWFIVMFDSNLKKNLSLI